MLRIDGPWDGIATLTLDRPERKNALSVELRDRLSDVLDALAADEAVRVVVLTGDGRRLLRRLRPEGVRAGARRTRRSASSSGRRATGSTATVLQFPLPIVAAVNGPAIAGGFDLAVMCDIRVAVRVRPRSRIPR